jgi:lipid-A-disaccharide synthase
VTPPTILLSAGEPSGDLHGARLARALKQRWPEASLYGLGGPRMAAEGVELLAEPERLAVMGLVEVVKDLPFFLGLLRRVRRELVRRQTDLVIPIDYPGFNLRLARGARRHGVPVLYYIAPQVWAWHRSRMARLARDADRLAVVLPFEEALFRAAGARATYVGHPLLDQPAAAPPREVFCRELGLDVARPILAVFPGSRRQEVERHLELFAGAVAEVVRQRPEVQPVVATGAAVPERLYGGLSHPRTAASRALLNHARAALVKSGTTTLEAALEATPLVIAYRVQRGTYWLARRLVEVPHIGLVNLVAERRVAPELVQEAATPARLAAELIPLLDDSPARAAALAGLAEVRARLGASGAGMPAGGAAERVAALAAELLER